MDSKSLIIKSKKPYVFKREVDWPDLDQLNHVNNKIFYRWIEISRTNYFHHLRIENFHENPRLEYPSIIIAEVSCKFLAPLNWPDVVEVRTQTAHIGKTSWILKTEIWSTKQNKKVSCYIFLDEINLFFPLVYVYLVKVT